MTMLDEQATFTGEIHPYADRWPMRTADELEALAGSIRANGLRFPIVLTPDGVLVDGRNRLRACEIAGAQPLWEVRQELDGEDAIVAFIWDSNGDHRRHMSKGQLAMLAALQPGSGVLLSNTVGVSRGYVEKARTVIEFCDEATVQAVIRGVDNGGLSLNDAYTEAQNIKATTQAEEIAARKAEKAAREEAQRQAQLLADLRQHRPDLADLVDAGTLQVADALTIRRDDAAKEQKRTQMAQEKRRKLNADFSVNVVTLAGLGEYPDRVADLLADWDISQQVVPVTPDLISNAIRGLSAVAEHLQGAQQ